MNRLTTLTAALRRGEPIAIDGALFDMDGTIVDSIPAVEGAWRIWAAEHGIPVPPASMHGKTAGAVVRASGLAVSDRARAEARLAEIEARPG
ncbi:HAD family hydrolase, partial [Microbacterium sp.]|uniref:HAD family hydrolase n=1 Tax=Microbacterium sp. TaxID=51671 RepID=UPI00276DBDD6|nr:HAD family hydrolase [Microbacterium sp.]